MSDQEKPNLSLPSPPPGRLRQGPAGLSSKWLVTLLLLQTAVLVIVLIVLFRGPVTAPSRSRRGGPEASELRRIAIQLEDRSLAGQAAGVWQQYLDAEAATDERPQILYRIGKLYMQDEQFEKAAAALVQCEMAASDSSRQLKSDAGRRLRTCFRQLGMYGEVGRELTRQVQAGAPQIKQGRVLASVSGEPLSDADLDRMIERRVDQMLAMQGMASSEPARQAMLREFAQPRMREQLLRQLLQIELFTRAARDENLHQDEEFLRAKQAMEAELLSERFQRRALEKIAPTQVDLEAYYETHLDRYREPASMQVIAEPLGPQEAAEETLEEVESADDFKQFVRERRNKADSQDDQLTTLKVVQGQQHPQLGDPQALFQLDEGSWTSEPHAHGDNRYLVLVEQKSPARTLPFDQVRERVELDYTSRKRQELSEKLLQDLMARYDVRIMPPAESSDEAPQQGPSADPEDDVPQSDPSAGEDSGKE